MDLTVASYKASFLFYPRAARTMPPSFRQIVFGNTVHAAASAVLYISSPSAPMSL